jgi:hypothetical protein
MTSSDPPVEEPASVPREPIGPTCRIIYRTPEPLTMEDATRMMADTPAVVSFAARRAALPAEQLPSPRRFGGVLWHDSIPFWLSGVRRVLSAEDELATIMPIRRLSYASPLEIILSIPGQYVAAGAATLLVIPTIVARFSRLRARFARDRFERDVYDALRERVQSDDVLARLDDQAFDGLFSIERAVTKDAESIVDSHTVSVDDLDEFHKFLDEHENDEGLGEEGPPPS